MEERKKKVYAFIWKHKLILWLLIIVIGVKLDFIHILTYKLNDPNIGGGYGLEINLSQLWAIIENSFIAILDFIKSIFK